MKTVFLAFLVFAVLLFGCAAQPPTQLPTGEVPAEKVEEAIPTVEEAEIEQALPELGILSEEEFDSMLEQAAELAGKKPEVTGGIRLYYGQNVTAGGHDYVFCGYSVVTQPVMRMLVSLCEDGKGFRGVYLPIGQNVSIGNKSAAVDALFAADTIKGEGRNESYIELTFLD